MCLEEFLLPLGVTQKQLADHLGCDVKVINRIVNGRTSVSAGRYSSRSVSSAWRSLNASGGARTSGSSSRFVTFACRRRARHSSNVIVVSDATLLPAF